MAGETLRGRFRGRHLGDGSRSASFPSQVDVNHVAVSLLPGGFVIVVRFVTPFSMTLLTTDATCRTKNGTTRLVSEASTHSCPRFLETSGRFRAPLPSLLSVEPYKRWSSRGRRREKKFSLVVLLAAVDVRAPHKHFTLLFTRRAARKVEFPRVSRRGAPFSCSSCLVLFYLLVYSYCINLPFHRFPLPLNS